MEIDWKELENYFWIWIFNENTTYTPYYLQPCLRDGDTFEICPENIKNLKW